MASTNKTTNYNLSQFLGTDKPAWLGDYNVDMSKIDTAMHNNATAAASAAGQAEAAQSTAEAASTDATNASTAANAAQETANTAIANAASVQSNVEQLDTNFRGFETKFNLNVFKSPTVIYNRGEVTYNGISSASNSDGSIGKIYGYFTTRCTNAGTAGTVTIGDCGLRPTTPIVVNAMITAQINSTGAIYPVSLQIETDGTVTIGVWSLGINDTVMFILHPCVIFVKDFGDQPITPPQY